MNNLSNKPSCTNPLQQNREQFLGFCFFLLSSYFFIFIGVQLIYNAVLVSGVQQSDSLIHILIIFQILFSYRLSQNTEQSSLCYTVGPFCLFILYIVVCVCVCSSQDSFCFVFFCLLYRFVVDFLKQNKHYKIPADLRSMNGHFSKITSREHTQNYFKHFNMSSSEMVEIKVKHFCQLKEYLFIEIILVKQS